MKLKEKKTTKKEREQHVLTALVEEYLTSGQPVGSNTLKNAGFDDISSATIRNYFASLEKNGFLKQLHTSGGRVPTQKAYRLYAKEHLSYGKIPKEQENILDALAENETKEISHYLQQAAETLSSLTECAVFLSAPRFDHDFISEVKLVPIDTHRFLCVLITDFGVIQTELLHTEKKLNTFAIKRIESYFQWRIHGQNEPKNLSSEESEIAQHFYNEVMLRYIVGYSTFIEEEIYRTGFSKLLSYPEFYDPTLLANSLSLFENAHSMRLLLRDCCAHKDLTYWIGDDLAPFSMEKQRCSVIAAPYKINTQTVGAIGILGPIRMPYKELFALMRSFSENISRALTKTIYKFKIDYRQPDRENAFLQKEEHQIIGQSRLLLIENKEDL